MPAQPFAQINTCLMHMYAQQPMHGLSAATALPHSLTTHQQQHTQQASWLRHAPAYTASQAHWTRTARHSASKKHGLVQTATQIPEAPCIITLAKRSTDMTCCVAASWQVAFASCHGCPLPMLQHQSIPAARPAPPGHGSYADHATMVMLPPSEELVIDLDGESSETCRHMAPMLARFAGRITVARSCRTDLV